MDGSTEHADLLEITSAGDAVRRRVRADIHDREDDLLGGLTDEQRECFGLVARHLAHRIRPQAPPASGEERRTGR